MTCTSLERFFDHELANKQEAEAFREHLIHCVHCQKKLLGLMQEERTATAPPEQPTTAPPEQPATASPEQPATASPEQPTTASPEQPATAPSKL